MPPIQQCARCRVGLAAFAAENLCPGCLLEAGLRSDLPAEDSLPVSSETLGTCIGPYKLLQLLGEGGMGSVWMAEQTEPVRRKVALKVIKPGMNSANVLARFEAERQALAL